MTVSQTRNEPRDRGALAVALAPLTNALAHRNLIVRMAKREVAGRYRGSLLGGLWAFATPLLMLGVYSFVFGTVFRQKWQGEGADKPYVLQLFAGLIVHGVIADLWNRAPGLMVENPSYIKKVVFPLDTLVWAQLGSTMFTAAVGFATWLAFHLALAGAPPWTALLLPLPLVPLCLFALGTTWILASLGVFLRDLRHAAPVLTTVLLFASPVFYPAASMPESARAWLAWNPLVTIIEQTREVLLVGRMPDLSTWSLVTGVAALACVAGHAWFEKSRRGFADVV